MWLRRRARLHRGTLAFLAVTSAWVLDVLYLRMRGPVGKLPASFSLGSSSSRLRSHHAIPRSRCVSRAVLHAGDVVEIPLQEHTGNLQLREISTCKWVNATVDVEVENGIKVHYTIDGHQYHLAVPIWRRRVHQRNEKTDGKKDCAVDVNEELLKTSSVPESNAANWNHLPQDLWLNGTVTSVNTVRIDALVEPPHGSGTMSWPTAPCQGRINRQHVVTPFGGTEGAMSDESEGSTNNRALISPKEHFSLGDKLQVRVLDVLDGKLVLSMKEHVNLQNIPDSEWHEAVITGISPFGLFVSMKLAGDGQSQQGLVPTPAACLVWGNGESEVAIVGQKVQVRVVEVKGYRIVCSMLPKQDVTAWKKVRPSKRFRGNITAVGAQYALVQVQRSKREPPVQGYINRSNSVSSAEITPGQQVSVQLQSVSSFWGKLSFTMM